MIIRAHSGAKLHAKLKNKPSTELQKSFMWSWEMSSQRSYSELAAELRDSSQQSYQKFQAKLENTPTMELLLACCEVRTELASKLGVSLLGVLQKARLGSLSAPLDQWSLSYWFVKVHLERGWIGVVLIWQIMRSLKNFYTNKINHKCIQRVKPNFR